MIFIHSYISKIIVIIIMNIIKYFILLLLTFVIKVNSGVYNHLDIQLALLILSFGDHNGNIIKDANNEYMKVRVGEYIENNHVVYIEKDITEIIPALAELNEKYKNNPKLRKESVEKTFKELYIKAERLATYRMGFTYDPLHNIASSNKYFNQYTSNLFNEFKFNTDDMRNSFDTHVNDIDIIRYFTTNQNNGNIKLVDGNNELDLLTFFNINMDISDYDNNLRNFKSAIQSGNGFTAQNTNNINLKSDVISIFDKVSKLCHNDGTCRSLFNNPNNIKYPNYSLIKDDDNHKLHFIVYYTGIGSNNNSGPGTYYFTFDEIINNNRYTGNYIMNPYNRNNDFISPSDLSNRNFIQRLNGHNKRVSNNSITGRFIEAYGIGLINDCKIKIVNEDNNGDLRVYQPSEYKDSDDRLNDNAFYAEIAKEKVLNTAVNGVYDRITGKKVVSNSKPNDKTNLLSSYYNNKYYHIEHITYHSINERNNIFSRMKNNLNSNKKLLSDIDDIKISQKIDENKDKNYESFNDYINDKVTNYFTDVKGDTSKREKNTVNKLNELYSTFNEMSRDNFKDYCLKNYLDELKSKAITNLCNKNENEYNIYKANYMLQHNNINDEEIIKYNFIKSKNFRDEVFDEEINNIIDNEYNDIKQISPKTKPKRSFTDDYRDYYYIEDNEDEKDTEKKIDTILDKYREYYIDKNFNENVWNWCNGNKDLCTNYMIKEYLKSINELEGYNEFKKSSINDKNLDEVKFESNCLMRYLTKKKLRNKCGEHLTAKSESYYRGLVNDHEQLYIAYLRDEVKKDREAYTKEKKEKKEKDVSAYLDKKYDEYIETSKDIYRLNEKFKALLKVCSLEINKQIYTVNNLPKNNQFENEIIADLANQNYLEKAYPVNLNTMGNALNTVDSYKFESMIGSNSKGHVNELEKSSKLYKKAQSFSALPESKYKKLCGGKNAKRAGSKCTVCNNLRILQGTYIDTITIETLKMLKNMKLDTKILPYTSEIDNINDIKMLIKDIDNIDDVWKNIIDTYKNNIGFFDKDQSEQFIRNINSITNEFILKYTDSRYYNNEIDNIGEENIENLLILRAEALSLHESKYGEIEDLEFRELDENDSQSKYNKDRFKKLIHKLAKIANINPNTIIDAKDPKSAINNLCEKLNELDEIEDIGSIYSDLSEFKSLDDFEFYQNDDTSLNSELVHLLFNTIDNKNNESVNENEEIRSSENNLKILNKKNPTKSSYERFADSLAFAILAAGKEDSTLSKELDKDGNLIPVKINVMNNGEEAQMSINEIIPSLQGLQGKELEDKFLKLYEMSMVYYLENFDTFYDENKKRLVYKTKPMDTLKNSNVLRNIIKAYNINENNEIEYFDLNLENSNTHYSSDSNLDNKFKSFILDVDSSELEKIEYEQ